MISRIKKFLCAGLIGASLIFGSTVEAGIVTDRLPLTCYCEQRVNTYNEPNGNAVGYISANVDLIQVTQIRSDGWAYGSYPTSRGRVSRWFRISDLCADVNYSNRSANVRGNQTVFRTRNGGNTLGSVSNNESVIVIADNGSRAQIVYRLDNGTGYKMGWVASSAVPSNSSTPTRNVQAGYAMLNDGWYKISPLHATNRVLDVDAASTAVGANIQLANPNPNSAAQLWRLVYSSTQGAYYIESRIRDKLAFDCADTGSGNGTNIWLWEYGDVNWNKWRFTPVRPPQNSQPSSNGLKGDVNGDGQINQSDVNQLLAYVKGQTQSINRDNSDVNGDGSISISDVQALLNKIRQNPQPTPQPTPQPDSNYDSKINSFINDSRFKAGSSTTWDCFAYATQFVNNVYGISGVRNGQRFNSVNEIKSGDVIHVNNKTHWIVVLYRNGDNLTTIEGNWYPKMNNESYARTRYSNSAYTITNGRLYHNGQPFRTWDCGYHYQ